MASMTEQGQVVESPFSRRPVQLTLAMIAACVFVWFTFSSRYPSTIHQHRAERGVGVHAHGHQQPIPLRIEVNSAPARELALLPGVGPVLANRIVQNRLLYGRFESLQELARVHGIGPKKLLEVGPICVFGDPEGLAGPRERLASSRDVK